MLHSDRNYYVCFKIGFNCSTYMNVADIVFRTKEATEDDGICGVKVVDKLARHVIDLYAYVQPRSEALILGAHDVIHLTELFTVQLQPKTAVELEWLRLEVI